MRFGRDLRHFGLQRGETFHCSHACRGTAGFVTNQAQVQRYQSDIGADATCDVSRWGEHLNMATRRRQKEPEACEHIQKADRKRETQRRTYVIPHTGRVRGFHGAEEGDME